MSAQHTRHHGEHIDPWLTQLLTEEDHHRHRAHPEPDPPTTPTGHRILPIATAVIVAATGWTGFIIQTVRLDHAADDLVQAVNDHTALTAQVQRACTNTVAPLALTEWVPVCQVVMPEDLDR